MLFGLQYFFILKNDKIAINKIKSSLESFKEIQNYIDQQFKTLDFSVSKFFDKSKEEIESSNSYMKTSQFFEVKREGYNQEIHNIEENTESRLELLLNKDYESKQFAPELREHYVKKKKSFSNDYQEKIEELTTGEIYMECLVKDDLVLSNQLCVNGPSVVEAVKELIVTAKTKMIDNKEHQEV